MAANKTHLPLKDALLDFTQNFPKKIYYIVDFINACLVQYGARRGFIPNSLEKKDHAKMFHLLKQYFPNLKVVDTFNQNVLLIIKDDDPVDRADTHTEIGKLLGYPCAEHWITITNLSKKRFSYSIVLNFTDFISENYPSLECDTTQLFAFVCADESFKAAANDLFQNIKSTIETIPGMDEIVNDVLLLKRVKAPSKKEFKIMLNPDAASGGGGGGGGSSAVAYIANGSGRQRTRRFAARSAKQNLLRFATRRRGRSR
jgi:hypothetical protein